MGARFKDDKDQEPNIVQRQIIGFWLLRYIPALMLHLRRFTENLRVERDVIRGSPSSLNEQLPTGWSTGH